MFRTKSAVVPNERDRFSYKPWTATDEDMKALDEASNLILQSKVVGIPTETVYGLAANALDPIGVSHIFKVKGRPSDNPLIVHVSSREMLFDMVIDKVFMSNLQSEPKSRLESLMNQFWPGPLTILFPKSSLIPDAVTCGQPFVAVRFPSHPVTLKLIDLCGVPLAAPSANLSGRPSPTCGDHVYYDLVTLRRKETYHNSSDDPLGMIIDAGPCLSGLESSVLDPWSNGGRGMLLRPGGITAEDIRRIYPDLAVYQKGTRQEDIFKGIEERPSTPGMKYRHYSPSAPVILYEGQDFEEMTSFIQNYLSLNEAVNRGTIGIVHKTTSKPEIDTATPVVYYDWGKREEEWASRLFDALRSLDEVSKVSVIFIPRVSEFGQGLAIMNRLEKASSNH